MIGDDRPPAGRLAASIVVPYLDADATIAEQLSSILDQAQGRPVEIVVVDNGSRESGRRALDEAADGHDGVRIVDGSTQRGAAYARNVGAACARGELLIFVDADDVVAPGWLEAYLAEPPQRALFAGAIDEWALARYPTWGARSSRLRPPRTMRGHVYAISANCAIAAPLFVEVGGFMPSPGGGVGEDVALSWTVEDRGLPVRFVPGAVVLKRARDTRLALLARWFRYGRSAPALERLFPTRRGRALVRSEWTRTRADVLIEVADTIRHPIRHQGVFWQLAGLTAGRLAGAADRVRNRRGS